MSTQLLNEMKSVFEQFKEKHSQLETEVKRYGEASQETKDVLDRLNDRLDELETKMSRPALGSNMQTGQVETEHEKAFNAYLRKGERGLTADELKALSTDSDPDGGYMVPTQRANSIIEKLVEYSPIRTLANVVTITGNAYEVPAEDDPVFEANWVSERGARPETATGSLRMERIPVHEIYAKPRATQTMLDDSAFNVEGWINNRVATRFAVLEAQAFLSGDGVGKPEGILTKSGIAEVVSGDASKITADSLIEIYYNLPEFYVRNSTWLMKRSTIKEIRKLKTNDNQYLWQPGLAGVAPATILDRPYVEAVDMPSIATNAYPVLFGDFRAAYTIVDRQGIRILRDPYSSKPYVEFYTTRRVGGQVVQADALRKLKIST
jgi:HK97 family phage major capsid protein